MTAARETVKEATKTPGNVLFVDDDANLLNAMRRSLGRRFHIQIAEGAEAAMRMHEEHGPFAVVVSDQRMPGKTGTELLSEFSEKAPDTVRIMLTGNSDPQTPIEAINDGKIFRFFNKPCTPDVLAEGINDGIRQYNLVTAEKDLLERTLAGSVKVLLDVLSVVSPAASSRAQKLRKCTEQILQAIGVKSTWDFNLATMLSPIGLITLPEELIDKWGTGEELTPDEKAVIAEMPATARDLIANIPRLKGVSEALYFQTKGFDGSGIPEGPEKGKDLPLFARILKVANDIITEAGDGSLTPAAVTHLMKHRELYDPDIIQKIEHWLKESGVSEPSIQQGREVKIHELEVGDILLSDIRDGSGKLLLSEGFELTRAHLSSLWAHLRLSRNEETIRVVRKAE